MTAYVIRSADTNLFQSAGHLVADVFSGDNPRIYERILHDWVANLPHRPGFDYELCRVGVVDGELVSQVLIEKNTLLFGNAHLRVAMIGKVATAPNHRHKGYSSALIGDTLATIAEQGAHLAFLNDLSNFYHHFGFSSVLPDTVLEVDSKQAMDMPHPLGIRHATPADINTIARLYHRHWRNRISFARSEAWWQWKFESSIDPVLVAVTQADTVQGYIWRANTGNQLELICDSLPATMTLLSFLGKRMQKLDEPHIQLLIPPDDVVISFVRQMMDFDVRVLYHHQGGWMGRVIDSTALLNALLPEIANRALRLIPDFNDRDLYLTSEGDAVTIGLRSLPQYTLHLSHRDFIQVMFGSLSPVTLALRDHLPVEKVRLLEVLFPPRVSAIAPLNWL